MHRTYVLASMGVCLAMGTLSEGAPTLSLLPTPQQYTVPGTSKTFSMNVVLEGAAQTSGYILSFYITGPDKNLTIQSATCGDIVLGTSDAFAFNSMDPYQISADPAQTLYFATYSPASTATLTDHETILSLNLTAAAGTAGDYGVHFFTTPDGNGMESAVWDPSYQPVSNMTFNDGAAAFVPEPGILALGLGTVGSGLLLRRRTQQAKQR